MKKFINIIISLALAMSMASPVLAESSSAAMERPLTPEQTHAAAIKKANADYKAVLKKAEADYLAAVDAARAVLKKAREDARVAMQAAKKAADAALKAELLKKKAALKVGKNLILDKFLVAKNGRTLYTKKDDSADKSTCYGECAKNWPPYTIKGTPIAGEGVTGKVGTMLRTDGRYQVTYNGLPLYFWSDDKKAGDTTGNGFGGIWFVVLP